MYKFHFNQVAQYKELLTCGAKQWLCRIMIVSLLVADGH